jgi:hypothetical protein
MKIDMEKMLLVFFFGLMLYMGSSALFEQRLSHDYPVGYKASDTFQHQIRTESIKDMGNYRYEASYIAAGFKDVIGFYPPVLYHVSAIFSQLSGLESYDATYLIVIFFTIMSALVMYYMIRRLNKHAAIMSLPLMLLVFTDKFYSGITWGQWAFFMGSFFMVCSVWALTQKKLRRNYMLLGLFLSATFLTHTSDFIFLALFIAVYLAILLLMKRITSETMKRFFLTGLIIAILTAYFVIIFTAWMNENPYSFKVESTLANFKNVFLIDFGWILPILFIGIFLALIAFYKKPEPVLIFGAFMLLIGYTSYIGFGIRAFQTRFFFPIHLSIFFGLTLHQLLRFVIKKRILLYVALSVLMILLMFKVFYEPAAGGIMNPYHWRAIEWMSKGTDRDDVIFFFYSPLFHGQTSLDYSTQRKNHLISYAEMERDADKGVISRQYSSWVPFDGGAALPYKKGPLSFGYHMYEENLTYFGDICSYDYYVFDKTGTDAKLSNFNILVASMFLNNNMSTAFNNEAVLIIFKLIYLKEDITIILKTVLSIFWIFILPGFYIMYYWHEKLGFGERLVIGVGLSAAITGISSYYLGLIGLNIKYHTIMLPLTMLGLALFLVVKAHGKSSKGE